MSIWQLAWLSASGERVGKPLGPDEISLSEMIDTARLAEEARLLASVSRSSASVFVRSGKKLVPLVPNTNGFVAESEASKLVAATGDCCLQAHKDAAEEAIKTCRFVRNKCACGVGTVQSAPFVLRYLGRTFAKGAVTFATVNGEGDFSRLEELCGKPEDEINRLVLQSTGEAGEYRVANASATISAFVSHLSEEISAIYSLYRISDKCRSAELSLRGEKKKLENILRSVGAALVVHGEDMSITWVNDVAEEWFGSRSELLGKRCVAVGGLHSDCKFPCEIAHETGQPQIGEISLVLPDGQTRYYRVTASPVSGGGSCKVKEILELIQDVTSEVRSRHQLENYRVLFDNVDDFVLQTDMQGKILAANRKVWDELGFTESELLGQESKILVAKEDLPAAYLLVYIAVSNETSKGEIRLAAKDGRIFETELIATFSKEDSTIQGIFRDVSERRRMERELRDRTSQLEAQHMKVLEATKERDRFFRNISHELRTPMTSIIGFTELLLEDTDEPLTPGQRMQLEKVAQNSHRMLMLINDLLDLSKMQAGKMSVNFCEVDVADLVTQVVTTMEPLVRDKPVSLLLDLAPQLSQMTTDEQKLSQILINLLSNAIKFTDKGNVTVSVHENKKHLHISVADTGIGINSQDIDRIFDEFQQAENVRIMKRAGTGLGLAITRRLTDLLGGKISVQSTPGKGSVFTVALPLKLKSVKPADDVSTAPTA